MEAEAGEHVREECGGRLPRGRAEPTGGTGRRSFPAALLPPTARRWETVRTLLCISFTLFCCYRRISFFVLRCHILPCSSFNFLVENCITDALFFL